MILGFYFFHTVKSRGLKFDPLSLNYGECYAFNMHCCCFFHTVFGTPWINITQGPEDTYVTVGDVVPCYCIYNGTDDFPTWRINNISHSPNALPPGHIVNKTGIFFQAFPETNQSTYQCQFSYYNNSSKSFEKLQSDTGRVHVQGELHI